MTLLTMTGIVKRFPGVVANDGIDFDLRAGEIHALLGENGAGKSTLMKILAGVYHPDEGQITLRGETVKFASPRAALEHGIGMIYQHFTLVEPMTVLDNIVLGLDDVRFVPDARAYKGRMTELAARYGLQVDLDAAVWQLSVGEQQRVEILRLLARQADVIILDEPTAVLTAQETAQLGAALRQMTAQGKGVILITHKLDEVMRFADRVTVLRRGRSVATLETSAAQPVELARLMLGREVDLPHRERTPITGEALLSAHDLTVRGDRGLLAVRGVSLTVHRGEIVGIAGVAGNGQRELADALAGVRASVSGTVTLAGRDITRADVAARADAGLSYIPEDRMRVGSVAALSVLDNLALKGYGDAPLSRRGLLSFAALRQFAGRLVEQYGVKTPSVETTISALSGGNIQKVILARELSAEPSIILAAQPTRGLDVGAASAIHERMLAAAAAGAGILLISEDLDELLTLCDRIAVMHGGEIMGVVPAANADLDQIGLMMAGALRLIERQTA